MSGRTLEFTLVVEGVPEEDYMKVWESLSRAGRLHGVEGSTVRLWAETMPPDSSGDLSEIVEAVRETRPEPGSPGR